jgi:hypothetical protein
MSVLSESSISAVVENPTKEQIKKRRAAAQAEARRLGYDGRGTYDLAHSARFNPQDHSSVLLVREFEITTSCFACLGEGNGKYDEKAKCKIGPGCKECGYTGKSRIRDASPVGGEDKNKHLSKSLFMQTNPDQLDIFKDPEAFGYPNQPGWKEAGTSREAAESIHDAALIRVRCLEQLKKRNMTADEVACKLGMSILSVRPRISELSTKGLIVKTKEKRNNASGKRAVVWAFNRDDGPAKG